LQRGVAEGGDGLAVLGGGALFSGPLALLMPLTEGLALRLLGLGGVAAELRGRQEGRSRA
jgi:hypothetical protein